MTHQLLSKDVNFIEKTIGEILTLPFGLTATELEETQSLQLTDFEISDRNCGFFLL
jgi:hypothetical protein